jgi:hypothetical protein
METLVLDGKRYVKASKAAESLGYTADYVGQLCRGGHIRAHLVGRVWYVDPEELSHHRVEKKRNARVKAREQARRSIAEAQVKSKTTQNNYVNVAIRYQKDDGALLPEPRKLEVEAEPVPATRKPAIHKGSRNFSQPNYELENAGEKILMKGKLIVHDLNDADDEPIRDGTIVLTPRIISKPPDSETADTEETDVAPLHPVTTESTVVSPRPSFSERVTAYGGALDSAPLAPEGSAEPLGDSSHKPNLWVVPLIAGIVSGILVILSFGTEWQISFGARPDTGMLVLTSGYTFSVADIASLFSILWLKI